MLRTVDAQEVHSSCEEDGNRVLLVTVEVVHSIFVMSEVCVEVS